MEFISQLHDREALLAREGQRRFLESDGWVAWPGPAMAEFLRQFIAHNRLLEGGFMVDDRLVTLADIATPDPVRGRRRRRDRAAGGCARDPPGGAPGRDLRAGDPGGHFGWSSARWPPGDVAHRRGLGALARRRGERPEGIAPGPTTRRRAEPEPAQPRSLRRRAGRRGRRRGRAIDARDARPGGAQRARVFARGRRPAAAAHPLEHIGPRPGSRWGCSSPSGPAAPGRALFLFEDRAYTAVRSTAGSTTSSVG